MSSQIVLRAELRKSKKSLNGVAHSTASENHGQRRLRAVFPNNQARASLKSLQYREYEWFPCWVSLYV